MSLRNICLGISLGASLTTIAFVFGLHAKHQEAAGVSQGAQSVLVQPAVSSVGGPLTPSI